jgi:hypothetical protein
VAAAIEQALVCLRQADQERLIVEDLLRVGTAGGADKPVAENPDRLRLAARLKNRGNNPRARPKIAGKDG